MSTLLQNNNRLNVPSWLEELLHRTQVIENQLYVLESAIKAISDRLEAQGFEKEWYTVGEVATRTGKSSFTIRVHYVNAGKLEARKTENGRWLIHKDELRRMLQGEL